MTRIRVKSLKEVLKHSLGKDFDIVEEKYSHLTKPGEHYGSIMLAVDVTIKKSEEVEETLKLVVKLIPANQMLREAFDISVTFKKEAHSYTVSIPTLIHFQEEYNVPKDKLLNDIFPKCYGARISLDPNKNEVDEDAVIIFENLKIQGYATDDRMRGFDLPAAKLVLKDLGRFHAVPIAFRLIRPEVFKKKILPSTVPNIRLEQFPPDALAAFHGAVIDTMAQIPDLQCFIKNFENIMEERVAHAHEERPKPNHTFATMVHSDYWVSNTMMLRDKNGNPLKNKMVDLQLMTYQSALRDLVFFLFTSVDNKVLDVYFDEFLNCYYESFIDNLSYFDVDLNQFSYEAFIKELNEIGPDEVYHILLMLKPIFTERDKVQNHLEDFKDEDWNGDDLLGEAHRKKLKDTVLALAKRHWL